MYMVGWLTETQRRGWRPVLEVERRAGALMCRGDCPLGRRTSAAARRRRLLRTARSLLDAGCRRCLTAPTFDGWPVLAEAGLRPVEPGPLCAALAPRLALTWLRRAGIPPEGATVALAGRRVDRALFEAAAALAPQVRRLAVEVPGGEGEDLLACLGREYGLPALEGRTGAEVTLCFSGAEGEGSGQLVLWGDVQLDGLILAGKSSLPPELDRLPLLELLWEEGVYKADEIQVLPGWSGQIS